MIANDSVWSWGTRSEEGLPSVFSAPPSPDLLPNPYHTYPIIAFHSLNNNNNNAVNIMKEGNNIHSPPPHRQQEDAIDNDNHFKKKNASRNLYVASLPNDFTKEELFELFEEFGEIISCEMRPFQPPPPQQQRANKNKHNNINNNNNNNKTGYGTDHSAYGFVCFRRLPDAIRAQRARVGYILPSNKHHHTDAAAAAPRLQVRFTPAPAFLQRRAPSVKRTSLSPPPSSSSSSTAALPICPTSPVMLWYWYPMPPSSPSFA